MKQGKRTKKTPTPIGYLGYVEGDSATLKELRAAVAEDAKPIGRISNALTKSISYARDPSLFDPKEIEDRDRQIMEELKEEDRRLCIDRRNKPVYLTPSQNRIVYAFSYLLSQLMESDEEIAEKIKGSDKMITRVVNISELSKLIFNSARKRYRDQIFSDIFALSHIRQIQILETKDKDNTIRITAPLISIGATYEELTPDEYSGTDAMEITFGRGFFYNLDKRFSYITPLLFEVWRKNGRGTQLFSILLSTLHSRYWNFKTKANKAEDRVRKENKGLTPDELSAMVREARREAMSFELTVANIKERITTDYDSDKNYRRKFWTDLDNAIKGFQEANLIERAEIRKGAKGQDKVIFIFSETYASNMLPPHQKQIVESGGI